MENVQKQIQNFKTKIKQAHNLTELKELLQEVDEFVKNEYDLKSEEIYQTDSLPTFGGEAPEKTNGVWSWDQTCLLVSDQSAYELRIIPREEE